MLEIISITMLGAIAVFTGIIAVGLVLTAYIGMQVLSKPAPPPIGTVPIFLRSDGQPHLGDVQSSGEKTEGEIKDTPRGVYL